MRVMVAGGAGFLGSHLCEALLRQGHQVLCVDNLITGRRENVAHLNGDFQLIEQDITERIPERKVDRIYNLAGIASPAWYRIFPVETMLVSVVGSANLLKRAAETGARILLASTSEVYGCPEVSPQAERYWGRVNSTGPRACYDEGKRAAEALFAEYQRSKGTAVRIARIFNTYGPRMRPDDGRVVSNFVIQALRREPITVHGDGSQTRSFCYVDDMVDGLLRLMESDRADGRPVNLGNPEERTIAQLARMVASLAGSSAGIVHLDRPEDDPDMRKPDIGMAGDLLGWHPRVTLDEGLARTIRYFREHRRQADKPFTTHARGRYLLSDG